MTYKQDIHHRRSIRIKNYDYSLPGSYFITICTQDRICLFGDVLNEQVQLNLSGIVIDNIWRELPNRFPSISLDYYVLMPNHLHGLINIEYKNGQTIHEIVKYFKSFSTCQYILGAKQNNWKSFRGKLWQRNYYEHIVRNEDSLNEIRQYIINNPKEWALDKDNPGNF